MDTHAYIVFLTQQVQQQQMKIYQLEQSVRALQQAVISVCFGVYDVQDYLFMNDTTLQFHIPLRQLHPVHLCTTYPPQYMPEQAICTANTLEHDKIVEQLQIGFESDATRRYQLMQRSWRMALRRLCINASIIFLKMLIMLVSFVLSVILLVFQLANKPRAIISQMFHAEFYREWFPMVFKSADDVELGQLQNSIKAYIEQIESYQTGGWCRAVAVGIFGGILVSSTMR